MRVPATPVRWAAPAPAGAAVAAASLCAMVVAGAILWRGLAVGAFVCGCILMTMALVMSLPRPHYLIFLAIALSSTAGAFRSAGSIVAGGADVSVSGWLTAVLVAGATLGLAANPTNGLRTWLAEIVPFLALGVLALLLAPAAASPVEALRDVLLMNGPLLYYVLGRLVLQRGVTTPERIQYVLLWSVLIPLTVLLASMPAGAIEYEDTGFRGLIGRRALALYLLVILALALSFWRYPSHARDRRTGRLLSLLSLGVIVISLSRMASAVALGILVPLRYLRPGSNKLFRLGALAIVGLSFVVLLLQWPPMRQRFFGDAEVSLLRLDEAAERLVPYGRDRAWALAWSSAIQRPLFGHGPGSARRLVNSWYPSLEHPHNEFLRIFHDLGIAGLGLLLWAWLGRLARHVRRWARAERDGKVSVARADMGASLAILAVLLSMVTDNTLMCVFVLIPLFLLLGIADHLYSESRTAPAADPAVAPPG